MDYKSNLIEFKERTCPYCNTVQKETIIHYVDSENSARLDGLVKNGEIFKHRCKACKKEVVLDTDMMYVNKPHKYYVLNLPHREYRDAFNDVWKKAVAMQQAKIRFRITDNVKAMYEKILILESGFADFSMELYKKRLKAFHESKSRKVKDLYYLGEEENALCFSFFYEEGGNTLLTVPKEEYLAFEAQCRKIFKEDYRNCIIDEAWANGYQEISFPGLSFENAKPYQRKPVVE